MPRPGPGIAPGPRALAGDGSLRAWAELLRISAPASVPGDLLAGAAAAGLRPNTRTALATLSSLLLYEAGMALNDWADRDIDAIERPHRPIPSGRITPGAALTAAGGLTAAGLACAAVAGRPALLTATALATTVWAYDLHLKNTPAGPTAMACARALDLLQGAVATTAPDGPTRTAARRALPSAALLGAHTLTITTVSRREAEGSSTSLPLLSLAAITALAHTTTTRSPFRRPSAETGPTAEAAATSARTARTTSAPAAPATPTAPTTSPLTAPATSATAVPAASALTPPSTPVAKDHASLVAKRPATPVRKAAATPLPTKAATAPGTKPLAFPASAPTAARTSTSPVANAASPAEVVTRLLAAGYALTAARPLLLAALNPSPHFLQRAVGGGIRAMIPLQGALAARAGAPVTGAAVLALIPVARRLSRKVSPT